MSKTKFYRVTEPNYCDFKVGDVVELTEKQAAFAVNKVALIGDTAPAAAKAAKKPKAAATKAAAPKPTAEAWGAAE